MHFDVTITHEPACTRVRLAGHGGAGRVLSLLQVLSVDSAAWSTRAVLLDVRALQPALTDDEQRQVAQAAAGAFGQRRVAILGAPGSMRDVAGLRALHDEAGVRNWLTAA